MFTDLTCRERERERDGLRPSYRRKEERTGLTGTCAAPADFREGGLRRSDGDVGRLSDFIWEVSP